MKWSVYSVYADARVNLFVGSRCPALSSENADAAGSEVATVHHCLCLPLYLSHFYCGSQSHGPQT